MRLFIGIPLNPALSTHLQQVWSGIDSLPTNLRQIPPANWHVTLAFLDEIDEDKVETLAELLAQATDKTPRGAFLVDRLEAFPRKKPVKITAHASLVDPESWRSFVQRIRDFASIVAPHLDRKPWTPHISIAKAQKGMHLKPFSREFTEFAWIPEEFVLYRSIQSAAGTKYETLYTFPLGL
ncbi:RNA 2',3'-cyclic phosphodiesterase [Candidatus Uhrbacteria bacterium]|nr:RNA 2',3'-cyclic phosphodiesterase [Candidatus Uhrbacteria bacterium]